MNENISELEDTLIDLALRESVGDETPPDLSERILATAKRQSLAAPAEAVMVATTRKSKRWTALFAIAASLFVAGLMLLPSYKSMREANGKSNVAMTASPAESRGMLSASPKPPIAADGSSLGLSGQTNEGSGLKMMVEPHIVSQKDEGESLSLAESDAELNSPGNTSASTQYPSEKTWFDLNNRRTKYASVDLRGRQVGVPTLPSSPRRELSEETAPSSAPVPGFTGGGAGGLGGQNLDRFGEPPAGMRFRIDVAPGEPADKNAFFARGGSRLLEQQMESPNQGRGPGNSGDKYTRIYENSFIEAKLDKAVSTFSIDVDTASYANVRQFLLQSNQLPPPDAVRIEELVNYFDYDYSGPTGDVPFAAHVEVAGCPWQPEHRLVRVGIKGREMDRARRPPSNLVFLVDVSGSMDEPNKLPLLVEGMKQFTRQLGENDRVAIVVYASSEGLALPSTRGDQQATLLAALDQLRAGGSTAGGAGIELAYRTAQENFIQGGVNRVILCTDGDFNVGVTSTAELERMAEQKAKDTGVFLTVLGFGRGNLNDAMMEAISGKGNGNYHYVDSLTEARKVLVEEMSGTLVTIAKDVKIQIEFNPAQVAGYRLIGYENRMLRTEDFNDDKKDAGEIGAGHTVTALYEIVPAGKNVATPSVEPLNYQPNAKSTSEAPANNEMLTLKIRYKKPDGNESTKLEFPITDGGGSFGAATEDFQFAAAVASFGMLLRDSEHRGNATYASVLETASAAADHDPHGYRAEFLQLVQRTKQLSGE